VIDRSDGRFVEEPVQSAAAERRCLTERQVDRRATGASANGVQGANGATPGLPAVAERLQQRAGNRATVVKLKNVG